MKKIFLVAGLIVLALGTLGVGVAFAQDEFPPMPMMQGMGQVGHGWMHDYVQQAFAAKLGITPEQVQDQLAAGKTMYQIALDNGIKQEDLAIFMNEVHQEAFDKAVKDGVATREQADWMLERMQSMQQGGFGPGNCPMHNGQGGGMGPGMMGAGNGMMRGMWGQGAQNP
jgi:hypothetical protein